MTDWSPNAWGLFIPQTVETFDFTDALANGCSFALIRTDNPKWAELVQTAYNQGVPVIGGVHKLDMKWCNACAPDLPNWSGDFDFSNFPPFVDLAGKFKFKATQLMILDLSSWILDYDDGLSSPWVRAIAQRFLDVSRQLITPEFGYHVRMVVPMVSESWIRKTPLPDVESYMAQHEQFSFADQVVKNFLTFDLTTWEAMKGYYPTGLIRGADGNLHSEPNYSFAADWFMWKWAYFKYGGNSISPVFYNGTQEQLFALFGATEPQPEPEPEPEPEPPADPYLWLIKNSVDNMVGALGIIIDLLSEDNDGTE